SQALDPVFSQIELQRNVAIPEYVRGYLENIVTESVTMRQHEWQTQPGINMNQAIWGQQSIQISTAAVTALLNQTQAGAFQGQNVLPLIEVTRQIHLQWCGVFPFCVW